MTERAGQASVKSDLLKRISLQSIVLWDCTIERGEAEGRSAGSVTGAIETSPGESPEGEIVVLVKGKWDFDNIDGERMVSITATYAVSYDESDADPDDVLDDRDFMKLSRSAIVQVTPFHREFLGSMTNRLGMPPFYLPLMRASDLVFTNQ